MPDTDRDVTEWSDEELARHLEAIGRCERSFTNHEMSAAARRLRERGEVREALEVLLEAARKARRAMQNEWHNKPRRGMEEEAEALDEAIESALAARPREAEGARVEKFDRPGLLESEPTPRDADPAREEEPGEGEREQWQRMAEESLRDWAEENPYDMSTDNEADPEHPSITANPASEEEPGYGCRICGRPTDGVTICRYCDRMMKAANRPAPEAPDRGPDDVPRYLAEADDVPTEHIIGAALEDGREKGETRIELQKRVKRYLELLDRLRSRPSSGDGEAVVVGQECHFVGDKHPNSRRAVGFGESGEIPMCADCLAEYANARKPIDPSDMQVRGPDRAAPPEGEEVGE